MKQMRASVPLLATVFLLSAAVAYSAVLGIDFGSELIKMALVKPGKPFHIVLDEHSKRKIPAIIGFDGTERHFGTGAQNLMIKRPKSTYANMQWLLGRNFSSPQVERFKAEGYPYDFVPVEDRNTIAVVLNTGSGDEDAEIVFPAEVLVAMTLQHLKRLADADAGDDTKDIVITVPSYWTQHQRQALVDACNLAGFKVLSLLNQNTAAVVQYGIDFDFKANKTYPVVFYNMGSTSTEVTLAVFSAAVKKSGTGSKTPDKTIGIIDIKAVTYDETLGAQAFENRLVDFMVDATNKKLVKSLASDAVDIRTIPKGMAKLRQQAKKVKEILSANTESSISVESVYQDIDLRTSITRDQFYELCPDLFDRIVNPLSQVLELTGYKAVRMNVRVVQDISIYGEDVQSELHALVTIGGSTRIRQVEKVLKDYLVKEGYTQDIGHNIDADESMAMGASFFAANLSTQFRVRQMLLTDVTPFPVGVRFNELPGVEIGESEEPEASQHSASISDSKEKSEGDDERSSDSKEEKKVANEKRGFSKRAALFKRFNSIGKRKSVVFSHTRDFQCSMFYDSPQLLPAGVSPAIITYNVTGLNTLMKDEKVVKLLAESNQKPKVHLMFALTSDGTVELVSADATLEETVQEKVRKPKPKPAPNATANATATANSTDAEAKPSPTESSDSASAPAPEKPAADTEAPKSESSAPESPPTSAPASSPPEEDFEYRSVKRTREFHLTISAEISDIKPMRTADVTTAKTILAKLDRKDKLRAEIAAAKNALEAYIYATRGKVSDLEWIEVTTEAQRTELNSQLDATESWLYEQQDDSAAKFTDSMKNLRVLSDPIIFRVQEAQARPGAINATLGLLNYTKLALEKLGKERPWVKNESRTALAELIVEIETWVTLKLEEQAAKAPHETPAFTAEAFVNKLRPLTTMTTELLKIKKPVEKKPRAQANATADANTTADGNSTDRTESTESSEAESSSASPFNESDASESESDTTSQPGAPEQEQTGTEQDTPSGDSERKRTAKEKSFDEL